MADAYDERPYTQHAYAETHPSRLGAVALLSGWPPPELEGARLLELGCGRGGNLLPMAAGCPDASFLGVDRSEAQIADARRAAAGAGLSNVEFVRASFDDLNLEAASFDYVVCHGVLSWIAPAERGPLLARIAKALAPAGIAHVSYNVLPGWYDRLAARDWLRFAARAFGAAAESAAESLEWLCGQVSPEEAHYARRLGETARRVRETGPAYAHHEYLASEHHPLLVGALLDEAARAGLAYLGDAIPATAAFELLPEEIRRRADRLGVAAAQQLADFVRCTAFRRTLLVRADEARRRSWQAPFDLDRCAVESLWIASRLRPEGPRAGESERLETFACGEQRVQVSDAAVRGALHELARAAPSALAFREVAGRVSAAGARPPCDALAPELFDLWLASGAIDLLAAPPASGRSRALSPGGRQRTAAWSPTECIRKWRCRTRSCAGCCRASTGRAPAANSRGRLDRCRGWAKRRPDSSSSSARASIASPRARSSRSTPKTRGPRGRRSPRSTSMAPSFARDPANRAVGAPAPSANGPARSPQARPPPRVEREGNGPAEAKRRA